MAHKTHYSAAELVALGLEDLPTSKVSMIDMANRERWPRREVVGRGGKRYEYRPPREVLLLVQQKAIDAVMLPALSTTPVAMLPVAHVGGEVGLSLGQANVEGARRGVLAHIDRTVKEAGVSRNTAMCSMLHMATMGTLDPFIEATLRLSLDKRGSKGSPYPSVRSIKGWRKSQMDGESLAPLSNGHVFQLPAWGEAFLDYYQQPQKPSVALAYEMFCDDVAVQKRLQSGEWAALPSVHQCRRLIGSMGNVSVEKGRLGAHELRSLKPFKRRKFEHLMPNDVWTADGHKFDAEVAHPVHKRPMRPEVTVILDVATRRVVGWSVDLAESGFAVLDAVRHGVVSSGVPALFYVDNGSGYVNKMMTDSSVGLMNRLGVDMKNSIAYNSQARGAIEVSHKNLIRLAQKMPTFIGVKMDRQAKQLAHKTTRKAIAAAAKGEALKTPLMPWDVFVQYLQDGMGKYNDRAHRALKGLTPNQVWAMKVAAGFEALTVDEGEAAYLFRPQMERVVRRCEVSLFGNTYFNSALEEHHGDRVKVAYDIHDGAQVWIYSTDDQLICTAGFEANAIDYMPQSAIEHGKDKRLAGREKRISKKLDESHAERGVNRLVEMGEAQTLEIPGLMSGGKEAFAYREPLRTIDASPVQTKVFDDVEKPVEPPRFTPPDTGEKRFEAWLALKDAERFGVELSCGQAYWLGSYTKTPEFRVLARGSAYEI